MNQDLLPSPSSSSQQQQQQQTCIPPRELLLRQRRRQIFANQLNSWYCDAASRIQIDVLNLFNQRIEQLFEDDGGEELETPSDLSLDIKKRGVIASVMEIVAFASDAASSRFDFLLSSYTMLRTSPKQENQDFPSLVSAEEIFSSEEITIAALRSVGINFSYERDCDHRDINADLYDSIPPDERRNVEDLVDVTLDQMLNYFWSTAEKYGWENPEPSRTTIVDARKQKRSKLEK